MPTCPHASGRLLLSRSLRRSLPDLGGCSNRDVCMHGPGVAPSSAPGATFHSCASHRDVGWNLLRSPFPGITTLANLKYMYALPARCSVYKPVKADLEWNGTCVRCSSLGNNFFNGAVPSGISALTELTILCAPSTSLGLPTGRLPTGGTHVAIIGALRLWVPLALSFSGRRAGTWPTTTSLGPSPRASRRSRSWSTCAAPTQP